jgi:polysaccharide chain length determinant protein (PEP-CTERM system associated)
MLPGRQYSPEDLLRLLWYRRWVVVAALVFCTLAAAVASMQITNQYRSETLILVIPQRVPESYVRSTVTMRIEDRLRSISEQILSRSRLEKVIDDFGLYPELRKTRPMEEVVAVMISNINIDTVRDDAFKVSFVSPHPRTAMIVADRLAGMFIDENANDREKMAQGTNQFLESQLQDARTRLVEHEKKLEDFRRRYSGELPTQLETNLQVIRNTQLQIQSLNESIDRDRDRRLTLEKQAGDTLAGAADAAAADGSTQAERTIDQLERARGELRALELRLKPEHPDVVAKKRAIAGLERQVQAENANVDPTAAPVSKNATADLVRQARARGYQGDIVKLDRQIAQKEADIERLKQVSLDYQRRVDSVPGHESELTSLMRDYDTLQKTYTNLLVKKEDSKISANLERQQVGEQFKMLDPARLPEQPYYPNRIRITAIGFGLGLMLGLGIAGFLEYRDTTLRTEDEIVKMLVLPVVAAIPVMTAIADRQRQRRNRIVVAAASLLLVAGTMAGALWRFGLLSRLH